MDSRGEGFGADNPENCNNNTDSVPDSLRTSSDSGRYCNSVQSYALSNDDKEDNRSDSVSLRKTRTTLFSPHIRAVRLRIVRRMFGIVLVLATFCLTMMTLYFGASYNIGRYYHKIKIIAVVQDDDWNNINSIPALTEAVAPLIATVPGTWEIFNSSSFKTQFRVKSDDKINARITKLIYDEKYWIAVNIKPNVTSKLYDSLIQPNAEPFNSTDMFQITYESGRDATNLKSYILPLATKFQTLFQNYYVTKYLPAVMESILEQNNNTLNHNNLITASSISFGIIDHKPIPDRIYLLPTQTSIIYCLLLSTFQFLVMRPVHSDVCKLLKPRHYILYRVMAPFGIFFFASAFFCTVSAIFHISFTRAFGPSGFMIFWMTTWLFMTAIGGTNENVQAVVLNWKPQFTGFWVSGFTLLNIAPTFYPMALNSRFYRYGYMMPVYNASAIFRVIFFDISRHRMGRNYGVLVAWIALNITLLPLSLKIQGYLEKKKIEQQKREEEEIEAIKLEEQAKEAAAAEAAAIAAAEAEAASISTQIR